MEPVSGSLFPAFGARESRSGNGSEGLDWLSNQSFRTEDALQLHHRITADTALGSSQASDYSGISRELLDQGEQDEMAEKKKKKKKKKKKHRQHKKDKRKDRAIHTSSESDPELLWDKDTETPVERSEASPGLPQGKFMWLDDLHLQTAQTFCIDRKADPANWEYKSLYRGDLARYRRCGDVCLGLDTRKQHIIWEDSFRPKKKVRRKDHRYYNLSGLQLLSTDPVPVRCGEGVQESIPGTNSFIQVPDWAENDSKSSGTVSWFNPLGVYDKSTALWLQGKGQEKPEEQTRTPLDSNEKINSLNMAKVEKFNRMLREDPGDVQTWMEFVHFQDELMQDPSPYAATAAESEKRKRSRRAAWEKKLAILERAIESNPNNVELKVARLELGKESWEPSNLVNEWKKVVFLHPAHAALWQRYLLFCQSQFSIFSTSKVNGIYGKCLSTLAAALDGTLLSHPALPDTEEAMLAIFLQQCHFLRQTGHSEKAIALFQALIDFTFFKPDSVAGLITKAQVEFFEPFWDSDEPRFGEGGARGWKVWMRQQEKGGWVVLKEQGDDEDEEEDIEEVKDKTLPKWQLWLQVESSRDSKHWLPWRADTGKGQAEEDCEDPDRQVLFDDIGSSMFKISSPELRFQLMSSFFQFLGIPTGFSLPPCCLNVALDDPDLFSSGSGDERLLSWSDSPAAGVSIVGFMPAMPSQRWAPSHCTEGEDFIQTAFHQALPLFAGKERAQLTLHWLQYEKSKVVKSLQLRRKKQLKSLGKKSKKLAKTLLKEAENRNNLALWREYAHLEWLLGNVQDSRKVFDTAMTMSVSQGLKDSALCDLCFLYSSLELESVQSANVSTATRAIYILTRLALGIARSPDADEVFPVNVLKARKMYEHSLQDWFANDATSPGSQGPGQLVSLVGCFALFQYLTLGIQAADSLYRQAAGRLVGLSSLEAVQPKRSVWRQSVTSACERLTVMHVTLLRFHMQASVYPLGPLRHTLTHALGRFPGNHELWKLYVQVESSCHDASRARRFFDITARSAKDLIMPRLFAIYAEERRKERVDSVQRADIGILYSTLPETGLTNRIRALFEHAVQTEAGAHAVLLWRMYLNFMVTQGNIEKIKGVFYRALQECPWAKVLYLDAVRHLPGQLQEILDLMTEKEIRIRVPLEELEILMED
ncbi:nuclear exosome regulator NRDE2 isoform X1 [Stegostoma tigrinum]|uniref:nuclear exosome regulator NRDE2 isoform X1 n=2 Tax=Stegostoma tigrinum TaxID=3053191 RepID=UPI00286FBD5D|nr:nuclear exosome regulator NRDE2 isoform X1 [Stegostoma tigrinum]